MALSATDVSSKVLLMSDNGWEVSFDGAANAFYNHTSTGVMDNPSAIYTTGGETALMKAASHGRIEICTMLLKAGANPGL